MLKFGLLSALLAGLLSVTSLRPVRAETCEEYTVPSTSSEIVYTSATVLGNDYTVTVSGTWQPDTTATGNYADAVYYTDDSWGTHNDGEIGIRFEDGSPPSPPAYASDHIYTFTRTGTGDPFGFYIFDDPYTDNAGELAVEVCGEFGGGLGGWIRPLLEADEYPGDLNLWDSNTLITDYLAVGVGFPELDTFVSASALNRVYAVSSAPGAPVLAAQGGTVHLEYTTGGMCALWSVFLANSCWFAGPETDEIFRLYEFTIDDTIQLVTITMDDGTELRYIVQNAESYLNEGQTIEAGCVIGETIAARQARASEIFTSISDIITHFVGLTGKIEAGDQDGFGVTMVEHRDLMQPVPVVPLEPMLTEYNTDDTPCNLDPALRDCLLDDPDTTNGARAWTIFGNAEATEAGVHLNSYAYMQQLVNLPIETSFTFRIGVSYDRLWYLGGGTPVDQTLEIRVGTFTGTITLPADAEPYQELTLEVPAPGLDPDGFGHTVRITNLSPSGAVYVQAACLTTNDHELNPRACAFANPDFDSINGWVSSNPQVGNGFVILGDADFVSQDNIRLLPNEDSSPRTYYLSVDVRPIAAPGASFNPGVGTATMYYSWDEIDTIGTLDLTWNQSGEPGYPDAFQTLIVPIEVVESTMADFIIYTGIVDNSTMRIALSRACISTEEEPSDSGTGGPFKTTCSTIPVPSDDSFGAWILYHWRNSDKFFNCRLMVLLNKWFKVFDDFRRTTLLFLRWTIALVHKVADWSVTVFWWLNGSFRNIATGNVTTVLGDNQCHDLICLIAGIFNPGGTNIFDVLLAAINGLLSIAGQIIGLLLALITQAANVLLTVIVGSIVFVIKIVGQILALLKLGQALLASLISAYNNATPIPIPFMPTCVSDPQSSGFCVFFWVADNTIFSGPGALIVPLLVAIGSIHLIIWVASEIRNTVLSVGSTS